MNQSKKASQILMYCFPLIIFCSVMFSSCVSVDPYFSINGSVIKKFSPDNSLIVTGKNSDTGSLIVVQRVETGEEIKSFTSKDRIGIIRPEEEIKFFTSKYNNIGTIIFTEDSRYMAVGYTSLITIYDTNTWLPVFNYKINKNVSPMDFVFTKGNHLVYTYDAVSSWDNSRTQKYSVWNFLSGKKLVNDEKWNEGFLLPDDRFMQKGDGVVTIKNIAGDGEEKKITAPDKYFYVSYIGHKNWLLFRNSTTARDKNREYRIYDLTTNEELYSLATKKYEFGGNTIISPDGKYLVIGTAEELASETTSLTESQKAQNRAQAALDEHNRVMHGYSSGTYYTPTTITTYWGFLVVFELETGKMVFAGTDDRARSRKYDDVLFYPSFDEKGTTLSARFNSGNKKITISWDTATWKPIQPVQPVIYQGDRSPDGRYIYCIYDAENKLIPPGKEYDSNDFLIMVLKSAEGKELWRKEWVPPKK